MRLRTGLGGQQNGMDWVGEMCTYGGTSTRRREECADGHALVPAISVLRAIDDTRGESWATNGAERSRSSANGGD